MGELLKDKIAIITGSGRGIGKAAVELFCAEGAKVLINDVDEQPAKEAEKEMKDKGYTVAVCVGSVTNMDDCNKIFKVATETFGKDSVDILVNNAGTTRDKTIHNMSDEWWHFIIDICLKGSFNMIRAAAPYMREAAKKEMEKGIKYHRKIINVSSIAGIRGNAGQANYASAKAGIIGLTKTIAREWGRFLINVNCIAPGFVDTRLTRPKESPDSPFGLPPGAAAMAETMIPLARVGQPEDIAKAMLFFASHLSDWITGQVLVVDGGLT